MSTGVRAESQKDVKVAKVSRTERESRRSAEGDQHKSEKKLPKSTGKTIWKGLENSAWH